MSGNYEKFFDYFMLAKWNRRIGKGRTANVFLYVEPNVLQAVEKILSFSYESSFCCWRIMTCHFCFTKIKAVVLFVLCFELAFVAGIL